MAWGDKKKGCLKCGEEGHMSRDCPGAGGGDTYDSSSHSRRHKAADCEMPDVCRKCNEEGHMARDCPTGEPDKCFKCKQEGHLANDCELPDKCFKCKQEGHRANDCELPDKCRNCGEEGHQTRDCEKSQDWGVTTDESTSTIDIDYGPGDHFSKKHAPQWEMSPDDLYGVDKYDQDIPEFLPKGNTRIKKCKTMMVENIIYRTDTFATVNELMLEAVGLSLRRATERRIHWSSEDVVPLLMMEVPFMRYKEFNVRMRLQQLLADLKEKVKDRQGEEEEYVGSPRPGVSHNPEIESLVSSMELHNIVIAELSEMLNGRGKVEEEHFVEDDPEEFPMTPTAEVPVSNELRSWSSIASGGSKGGASKPPMAPQGQPSVPPSRSESKEGTPSSQYGGAANKPYRGNRGTSQGRQSTGGGPRPERFQRDEDESSRSRMASVSDSQQLFVGNLPHNCTEQDLRELFSTFGKVTDLRINQKTGRENQSKPGREGVKVPNFGFIVFDNGEAVEKALKAKPILLFGSHRLNVEEKKMRTPRDNMGGGQGGFNDRGPPPGGRGERGSQDNLRGAGYSGGGRGGGRGEGRGGGRGRGRGEYGGPRGGGRGGPPGEVRGGGGGYRGDRRS